MSLVQKTLVWLIAFVGALSGASIGVSVAQRPLEGAIARAELTGSLAQTGELRPRTTLTPEERRALAVEVASVRGTQQVTLEASARTAIVQELALALQPHVDRPAVPEAPLAPSPEAVAARRDAELLLERAQSAKEWTERDVRELNALRPALSPDDQNAVLLALTRAMNEGRLTMSQEGLPY